MLKTFQLIFILLVAVSLSGFAQDNAQDLAAPSTGPAIIAGTGGVVPDAPGAVLFDQGQLVNDPGGGSGGADRSFIESALGHTLYGWGHQFALTYSMADDFTIPAGETWTIDELITFAYQTNATTTSTITGVYAQIWDGDPSAGGTVVWGNLTTNIMTSTVWSNIYRTNETTPTSTARAIMQQTSTVGTVLTEGTYWLEWSTDGSLSSGPWCPPVTILGVAVTGDALQNQAGLWLAALNGTEANGAPFILMGSVGGGGTITIAEAREDLNNDFIPDRLGDTVTVVGTVSSPNYNTGNFNYVIHDGTAGITSIFFGYTGPEYNMGDVVQVTGVISQYNGLTQLEPLDDASVVLTGTGGTLPDYTVLTLAQFLANAEMYEGELIAFSGLTAAGGGDPWPNPGSNANFNLTDAVGVDILAMRIDKETDLDDNPEPVWPKDVIGFGGQYSTATPPNDGYQLLARMYSEILPVGTVPVELTSFSASVSDGIVTLSWSTATEVNNLGFEIQRNLDGNFRTIGFVNGHGTTTETSNYFYADNTVNSGSYSYRLKQIDFNGNYEYSDQIHVEVVAPVNFSLEQNYPNPFNPNTQIVFNLATDSKVTLTIFNVLGEKVLELVNRNYTAGSHTVDFNAANLNSGVYFYRIDAAGVDGASFSSVKKMILTK